MKVIYISGYKVFGQINAVESKVCEPLNGMVRKEYNNLAPFKWLK